MNYIYCTRVRLQLLFMNFFVKIFAALYGLVISVRNFLYDYGLLSSVKFDIPVICVGNITVGGTGKTPMVEFLVEGLDLNGYHVGVISRGYGRRTKGVYIEVTEESVYKDVGDEPLQIKRKFPQAVVVVCADRVAGIKRMRKEHPELSVIVMDDGLQHRAVTPYINIMMLDHTRPVWEDHYLPYGNLRDSISAMYRCHFFMITKTDFDDSKVIEKMYPYQNYLDKHRKSNAKFYFTRVGYESLRAVFGSFQVERRRKPIIALSGVGNPEVFVNYLDQMYDVVAVISKPDHHRYTYDTIKELQELVDKFDAEIIMTEKDAVKFCQSTKLNGNLMKRMFYVPIRMELLQQKEYEFFVELIRQLKNFSNKAYVRG